jgi:pimeloyl-ACP methyl ester carboxylesterase
MRQHTVHSGGVTLAVREHPRDAAPTVVLVHGFPDTQAVWDPVVESLSARHGMAVVTYDVRGAGASSAPSSREGYRSECLVDDLVAVIDEVAPAAPVHLVGHDWGSVQLWDAVTSEEDDPRLRGRIRSFTSISGPSLDHAAYFIRRLRTNGDHAAVLRQSVRSSYVLAFQIPVLPELLWRGGAPLLRRRPGAHFGPTLGRDGANGVNLYRANIPQRMRRPRPGRTRLPVQVVIPVRDPFIDRAIFHDLRSFAPRATVVELEAGHWVVRQLPDRVADLVAGHVLAHDAG